jgi:site-specific recombinase XerD
MPVYRDARLNRWRYEFDRRIAGRRVRAAKVLPAGWSRAQADAFDRTESARLYAEATGIQAPHVTIDTAVAAYLAERGPSLRGLDNLTRELAGFAWAYVGRRIEELPDVAREYAAHAATHEGEREKIAKPATIARRIAYLRAACRFYWRTRRLAIPDPAQGLEVPAEGAGRDRWASRAEMLAVAARVTSFELRGLLRLAYYTGVRQGELWMAEVQGDLLVLPSRTKSGRPRLVPVPARARGCLRYLPPTLTQHALVSAFRRARDAAKLPDLRFHDLRHGAAVAMIQNGASLYVAGQVLGHTDPRTTQRYAQVELETLRRAVELIGRKRA